MLQNILQSAGLKPQICADLLGLDDDLFQNWLSGDRPIPGYIVPELSSVLGVPKEAILTVKPTTSSSFENAPAIWFRFRSGDKLTDADRELMVVVRKLGHYMDELEELSGSRRIAWTLMFEGVRKQSDKQASPVKQGKEAAQYFRDARQLGFPVTTREGVKGVGDILRDNLRSMGIRIVETPLPGSELEGCCFYVGAPGAEKPCLFANTYKQTWFRRNIVLVHELAHAIFDIETTAASLDFLSERDGRQLEELRADAFAREVLVPREMLHHIAQTNGVKWHNLTPGKLALLVAYTQVEQRTVIKAALENGFISEELAVRYSAFDIHEDLKSLTERALTAEEYVRAKSLSPMEIVPAGARTTTIPARRLRLPLPYVTKIVQLAQKNEISFGKAAQMLMIDKETFLRRFGAIVKEAVA